MRNSTSRRIIETLLEKAAAKEPWRTEHSQIRSATYTDSGHLALEHQKLFQSMPQAIALSADLPANGSALTRECGGVDILLTRNSDGEANAFLNVCRHRSSRVVTEERSCSSRLTCPYHAWSYDLNGSLVALPDNTSFPEVTVPQEGLRKLPIYEQQGVIWVTPSPSTTPVPGPDLGPFSEDFESFELSAYEHWRSHRFDLEMNWKLVIDTFLEPYHFASLHRSTVGPFFISNLCHAQRHGSHIREVLPRKSLLGLSNVDPGLWDVVPHSAVVYVLFPATVLVMQIDHVETWRVIPHPTDPGQSVCDLDFYIPLDSGESSEVHWEKNWQITIDTVINEDFLAMTGVQRGLSSGAFSSVTAGANEPALSMFHDILKDRLMPVEKS